MNAHHFSRLLAASLIGASLVLALVLLFSTLPLSSVQAMPLAQLAIDLKKMI